MLGLKEETRSYRAPVIGDHVISHHQKWAYFPASIVSFDRETMSYTVDWDDGDPTGKVQSYKVCRVPSRYFQVLIKYLSTELIVRTQIIDSSCHADSEKINISLYSCHERGLSTSACCALLIIFRLLDCRTWLLIRFQVKIKLVWTPSCYFPREVMVLLREITSEE